LGSEGSSVKQRFLLAAVASLVVFVTSTAYGEPEPVGPSENGWVNRAREPVSDTESRRSKGAFCVRLLVIDDPEFFKKWEKPSEVFIFDGVKSIRQGSFFLSIVAFANPAVDSAGNAHLVGDFSLFKPDGSLYGEMKGVSAWEGPPPTKNKLELTTKYLMGKLEPEDPLGTYQVEATIYDQVSGDSLRLRTSLVVESGLGAR
jgi:hypothetical protein